MSERIFGLIDSSAPVHSILLKCGTLEAEVLTYGARLHRLCVPDATGKATDIVLGCADLKTYQADPHHIGAIVGRYANRIARAELPVDGTIHRLSANEGRHTLHGGFQGFSHRNWSVRERCAARVRLSLHSPAGEEGFPGALDASVTYVLTPSSLDLHFEGWSATPTVVNLTSHAYFNLASATHGRYPQIDEHTLHLHMPWMLERDADTIPTGKMHKLSPPFSSFLFDPRPIGSLIADHHFAHDNDLGGQCQNPAKTDLLGNRKIAATEPTACASGRLRRCATLAHPPTGRKMEVFSTQPGMQIYTAQFLPDQLHLKDGATCGPRGAICLETQHYPDAPHHPHFPQPLADPMNPYREQISFRFTTQDAVAASC
jgi:aldose 1-epimerase